MAFKLVKLFCGTYIKHKFVEHAFPVEKTIRERCSRCGLVGSFIRWIEPRGKWSVDENGIHIIMPKEE